jgi:hypothetical protein
LQELEDSLLAEIFACQEVNNKLQNRIDDEHDYFKKNYEHQQILQESVTTSDSCALKMEINTEQDLHSPELLYMDPKKQTKTKTNLRKITLYKSTVELYDEKLTTMKENKRLSKSEQKSFKKFRRKMKNRVSKQLMSEYI